MANFFQRPHLATASVLAVVSTSLIGGSWSLFPAVWPDSQLFVSSAIQSLQSGSLVLGNVNIGYVAAIAAALSSGAGLSTLMFLQHLVWAVSLGLCAYTVVKLTKSRLWILPLLLLAAYPGIQIYQNLILTESFYTSVLTIATCLLLLAHQTTMPKIAAVNIGVALAFAGMAPLLKAQGFAPFATILACTLYVAARKSVRTVLVCILASALTVSAVAYGQWIRGNSTDAVAVLFGPKTVFSAHLNLVLKSPSTRERAVETFGPSADAILERLKGDMASRTGEYKTLGFFSDACHYDRELDQMAINAQGLGASGLARWYRDAFVHAVLERPWSYITKVTHQLVYGLKMSVPPHALGVTIGGDDSSHAAILTMLVNAGFPRTGLEVNGPIDSPILAHYEGVANLLSRGMSFLAAIALLMSLLGPLFARWRNNSLSAFCAMVALVWFSQIGEIALVHTLDVWRYIVPVVPAAFLAVSLAGCVTVRLVSQYFFTHGQFNSHLR